MQNYILVLIGVLVILLIGVIFYGWRKITQLEIEISKNKYDVEALRNLISKMLDTQEESENNNNLNNTEFYAPENMQNFTSPQVMLNMNPTQEDSVTVESVETTESSNNLLSDSEESEVSDTSEVYDRMVGGNTEEENSKIDTKLLLKVESNSVLFILIVHYRG